MHGSMDRDTNSMILSREFQSSVSESDIYSALACSDPIRGHESSILRARIFHDSVRIPLSPKRGTVWKRKTAIKWGHVAEIKGSSFCLWGTEGHTEGCEYETDAVIEKEPQAHLTISLPLTLNLTDIYFL